MDCYLFLHFLKYFCIKNSSRIDGVDMYWRRYFCKICSGYDAEYHATDNYKNSQRNTRYFPTLSFPAILKRIFENHKMND